MPISNSYFRALLANLAIFVALVAWVFYMDGGSQSKYHAATVGALEVGSVVGLIVTLLVGTLLRLGRKSWPWWFFGFVSTGCWLLIFFLMLLLTPHAGDLMKVEP
jgi:hypothetical protein